MWKNIISYGKSEKLTALNPQQVTVCGRCGVTGFTPPCLTLLCIVLKSIYICKASESPAGGKSPAAVVGARSSPGIQKQQQSDNLPGNVNGSHLMNVTGSLPKDSQGYREKVNKIPCKHVA